jgi:hypothetical protein
LSTGESERKREKENESEKERDLGKFVCDLKELLRALLSLEGKVRKRKRRRKELTSLKKVRELCFVGAWLIHRLAERMLVDA